MLSGGRHGVHRLSPLAVLCAALIANVAWAVAPQPASAAFSPGVGTIVLQTSRTPATSSTGHHIRVQLIATREVGFDDPTDSVVVQIFRGGSVRGEEHAWTFYVGASEVAINSDGTGSIDVPGSELSPFGKIRLKLAPIGDPTTQGCGDSVNSQTQEVSVKGILYFDTHSTGVHKLGTVGSKTTHFVFTATNRVVTTDELPATTCPGTAQCMTSIDWSAGNTSVSMEGADASAPTSSLVATRTTKLSMPSHAIRTDTAFATASELVIVGDGPAASLTVTAGSNAAGSARLVAKKMTDYFIPCDQDGTSYTQTFTTWDASYKPGTQPLTVAEQVFGAITLNSVTSTGNASFTKASYA